jgi:arylsulfatase A-like enzyme
MTADKPNVLLIILDSARARNTSLHDYHRETTPFLDEFAEQATVYTQARAPAGRSLPSHASIFTGYLPQEHGVYTLDTKLADGPSVFETLSGEGYATGLFTDNPYLTDLDTGLSNGFDTVINNRDLFEAGLSPSAFVEQENLDYGEFLGKALHSDAPAKSILNGLSWMLKWRFPRLAPNGVVFSRGFTYADRFDEWRQSINADAWVACINLMDTHVPFRPDDEYNEWEHSDSKKTRKRVDMDEISEEDLWKHQLLENRYDGTIRQADAVVEEIISSLREDGMLKETCVVITADHGEGFGERNPIHDTPSIGHGNAVDETLLHVPLLVKPPGCNEGRTIHKPVGLVDTPVAIDRMIEGDSGPPFVTDRSVFAGGMEDGDPVDVAYVPHESHGVLKYVRSTSGAWTLHVPTPRTKYVRRQSIPETVRQDMRELSSVGINQNSDAEVSQPTQKQLDALGYTE